MMLHQKDRLFHTLIWAARVAMITLMFAVALILDTASTERFRTEMRQHWQQKAADVSLQLRKAILQNVQTVWGLAASVSVEPELAGTRFQDLASVIFRLAPELRNIGLAPDFVIRHIYPLEGNEAALGLDLTDQSLSPQQIETLLESERALFSGPIDLVQGGQGLAARIPVFESRNGEFWGLISVILDLPRLYRTVNLSQAADDGVFALSTSDDPEDSASVFYLSARTTWDQPVIAKLQMPGTTWTLFAQPRGGWPSHPKSPGLTRGILFVMGLLVAGATFWLTQLLLKDREMQKRFWGLFELAPVGIGLYGANRRTLLRANQSFDRIVGNNADSIDYFESAYDQNGAKLESGLNITQLLKGQFRFSGLETTIPTKDGTLRPVLLHGLKLETRDSEPVIWLIAEDISERQKADRMKNEFVSTVSHELRTPLTSISGSLGLLANGAAGELPEQAARLASIAYRNSKQLTFLINDLLDIEKLVAGKMIFQMEPHHLPGIVLECIEEIEHFAGEKNVTLKPSELGDVVVEIDRRRFSQALHNLLSNAIKFSPEGAVVDIYTERHDQQVRVCVKDQGDGVSADFQDLIFQKFSQADASDRRAKGGTGLGLAITRELMTHMGGVVDYASPPGQGATFWLELPVIKPT
ncbi:hypothetical protein D777_02862 [Marinobacter nitratireducens]|uniref:histidine kinase n=1 Tax=Marinobacter nitratireducens TaxID=1137280 RepID=A0A072NCU5_9GAMM|nr:ATP-binding protein [Marinobacter nitratireducens]KEF30920.1 hypothetical protein D777_02862 [Marinobacter nitratireducens]